VGGNDRTTINNFSDPCGRELAVVRSRYLCQVGGWRLERLRQSTVAAPVNTVAGHTCDFVLNDPAMIAFRTCLIGNRNQKKQWRRGD
jgi:hypothetical protein